jgi:hypothetical protein
MRNSTLAYLAATAATVCLLSGARNVKGQELDAGSYVELSSAAANPFSGETLVDSVTSAPFSIYETDYSVPMSQWGGTVPQYLAATGSLTTSIYRATDGTYGFAYTINSQYNAQPFAGPPFNVVAIPNLTLSGLESVSTDVSASRIPDNGTSGTHYMSVLRSDDGQTADVNFSDAAVPIEHTPHYYSLMAGAAPVTVYVKTDATGYASTEATLAVEPFDARYEEGEPALQFIADSFVPVADTGAPQAAVPEPVTAMLLPLAVAGLGMRLRRRR